MKEIQGKSILVRVGARFESERGFELSGVDCIKPVSRVGPSYI